MDRPLMKLTPMLEQYFEIKRQVPDAILFYRLGDFYEMFFEDAEKAAPLLDLVLTARNKGQDHEAPMCGVPYHSADGYIAKLIRHGLRVAICEQTEDPAMAKGLVKREIVRVVTPGTATESAIVERDSCYLLSLVPNGTLIGAAYLDVSTGDFFVTSYRHADDARLGDAGQSRSARLARPDPPARVAVERRQRHALGHGGAHAAQVDHPAAEEPRRDLRPPRRCRRADPLAGHPGADDRAAVADCRSGTPRVAGDAAQRHAAGVPAAGGFGADSGGRA